MAYNKIENISGAGGGGGGGKGGGSQHVAVEAKNTLTSQATINVVEVLAEGEIRGLYGATPGQAIFINDTPIQNADLSYNFDNIIYDYRVGLPSQAFIPGFSDAESEIIVNSNVSSTTPITRSVSSSLVDAARVTISLPQGLFSQNTTNGDMNGSSVQFKIEKKLTSSGTWTLVGTYTIEGKTTSPYEKNYYVTRPSGSGGWDIRVSRITADSSSAALKNATGFSRFTEITDVKLEYPNTAYVAFRATTDSVGSSIPKRSYLVNGQVVKIPSNYYSSESTSGGITTYTRTYTGTWDGTFVDADTITPHNPVWALYDLLTNSRYGMGDYISPAIIDKWSMYDCARYCDELVPAAGTGAYEPRFTFDAVIADRREAISWITDICGVMRAQLLYVNGLLTLVQDRPADPVKNISKSNVIDGHFNYRSTGLFERQTAYNLTYADKNDRYLPKVTTTYSTDGIAKYGYQVADLIAWGATTEGQAIRQGRWALESGLGQTELVTFKMSFNGFDLMPFDIVKIYDEDYADKVGAGRIVSVVGTTVTLDRDVDTAHANRIEVLLEDGTTIESRTVASVINGHTLVVSSAFSQTVPAGADYFFVSTKEPRQFRIMGIKQESENTISVEAVYHDPTKYSRVETGITASSVPFGSTQVTVTTAPSNLTFKESAVNIDNSIKRNLLISWGQPSLGVAASYLLQWRVNTGTWNIVDGLNTVSYDLVNIQAGVYEVNLYAISNYGVQSPVSYGTYTIVADAGGVSPLFAPTNLVERNVGGTSFASTDLSFVWTNPSTNSGVLSSTIRDFEVRIIETTGFSTLRTFYVPAVGPGNTQTATYTFSQNNSDTNNVPNRQLKVEVRCRDTAGNLSSPVATTFTNAVCSLPSSVGITGGYQTTRLTYTLPTDTDFAGIMVWGSTTSGFTPSSANLLYEGRDSYVPFNALTDNTTYYYKIGSYDSFGKSYTGTGMNVSTQYSATTATPPGIALVTTLPGSGTEGQVVFNTTDGQLYRYHSGAWTVAVPAVNITGTLSDAQLAAISAAKVSGTLTDAQLSAISAAKVTGTLVNSQIADLAATKITGTLSDAQIAGLAASKVTGTLSDTQLSAISAAKVTGTLVSTQIASVAATTVTGTLSDTQLAAISASKVTGTLVASQIADATLTAAKFASTIEPITTVSSVPGTKSTNNIYNTTDKKLYQWNGTAYSATVPASDITGTLSSAQIASVAASTITGTLTNAQIADLAASKVTGTLTASQIASLAATQITGTLTDAQISALATTKLTGTIATAQIADAALTTAKFASGIEPVTNVATVPVTKSTNTIFNTTDGKLYRWNGTAYVATIATSDLSGTVTDAQIAGMAASKVTGTLTSAQIADLAATKVTGQITSTQITDSAITTAKIAANAITAGKIAADTITAAEIAAGAITTAELAAGAVTAAKITAGTITSTEIATGTIVAGNIASGTITSSLIAADTITAGNIASGAITSSELSAGAVIAGKIAAGIITATEIAGATITGAKIAAGTITASNLVADTITANEIAAGAITSSELATGAVTAAKITAGTITATEIASATITGAKIAAGTISASNLVASTITANEIASATITGAKIAAGTIAAANIAAGTITATEIASATITGAKIAAGTITASNIATDTITANQIAAGAITSSELATGSVTTGKLFVTGQGKALNDDPACMDISAWTVGTGSIAVQTDTTAPVGTTSIRTTNGTQTISRTFPVEAGKTYKVALWAKQISGAGTIYIRLYSYTAAGALTSYFVTGISPTTGQFEGLTVPSAWTKYVGYITPAAGCVYAQIFLHTNWNTTGVTDLTDIRCEEYISADLIVDGSITASKIAANTITASQIATDTITAANIAAGAITSSELATGAVTAGKVSAGVITATEIAASTITGSNIAANTITGANIVADTITASQIAAGAITSSELATGAVTAAKIVAGTITSNEIATGTITASNIATDTITSSQIAAGAITASELAASAVTAGKIAAGTITAGDIAASTITGSNIAAATITGANLVADTITAGQIAAGAITSSELATGAVIAGKIAAGTITSNEIAANTITAGQIAAATITSSQIAAGTIAASNIAAGTITADRLGITSLSAITANLGTITGGEMTIAGAGGTPAISGTTMTGEGTHLYSDGRFAMGNATRNIVNNGSQIVMNGFVRSMGGSFSTVNLVSGAVSSMVSTQTIISNFQLIGKKYVFILNGYYTFSSNTATARMLTFTTQSLHNYNAGANYTSPTLLKSTVATPPITASVSQYYPVTICEFATCPIAGSFIDIQVRMNPALYTFANAAAAEMNYFSFIGNYTIYELVM